MKLRLSVLALGLCLCLVFAARADAQLNFSTGWGKRSQKPQIVYRDAEAQPRHPYRIDFDNFIRYYRMFKQFEAQQLAASSI